MLREAERPGAGAQGGAGVGIHCEYNNTPSAPRNLCAISRLSAMDAGLLTLEYHITGRDTNQLLDDLRAMERAPVELDPVLRHRRILTVQALRNRGAG